MKKPYLKELSWDVDMACLKYAREIHGLSLEQFGKLIGKSGECIANWEKGKGAPSLHHVCEIANALKIDPRRFFTHEALQETA